MLDSVISLAVFETLCYPCVYGCGCRFERNCVLCFVMDYVDHFEEIAHRERLLLLLLIIIIIIII